MSTIKSYDLQPVVFTGDSVFNIAELLDQRARQLVAAEEAARTNADAKIVNDFTAEVAAINAEVARVRLLAESLGDAELAQLEDALLRVLTQPTFQELLSGGALDGFRLNSIVKALKDQPDPASIERLNPVHGVATVVKMGFTDGRVSILSADIVEIPADDVAGTPERLRYDYTTEDFLGLPAVQKVLFNVHRFAGSPKLWLEEVRRDLVLFDITPKFIAAGPAPALITPDLNTDGKIGLQSVADPVALARAALDAALAEKIAATVAREQADAAVVTAEADAARLRTAYTDLVASTETQLADARDLVDAKTQERTAAQTAVTTAEGELANAQAGGDPAAVSAAEAALQDKRDLLTQAEQALTAATNSLATLQGQIGQASAAADQADLDVTAARERAATAAVTEGLKAQAVTTAQAAYDAAVSSAAPVPAA